MKKEKFRVKVGEHYKTQGGQKVEVIARDEPRTKKFGAYRFVGKLNGTKQRWNYKGEPFNKKASECIVSPWDGVWCELLGKRVYFK